MEKVKISTHVCVYKVYTHSVNNKYISENPVLKVGDDAVKSVSGKIFKFS